MNQTTQSPKKPQSAFFIYSKENRQEFKQKYPNLSSQDITKELSKAFKGLPTDERKKWDDMAVKQKEDYQIHVSSSNQASTKSTPRKSKSKIDVEDETAKGKQSIIETRAKSHERENPHLTRSHGRAPDVSTESPTPVKTQAPKKAARGKSVGASVSPKSGSKKNKKKSNEMTEEKVGDKPVEDISSEIRDVPEVGPLVAENRNLSTDEAIERRREDKIEEGSTVQHPWTTGIQKTFTETRPDDTVVGTAPINEKMSEELPSWTMKAPEGEDVSDVRKGIDELEIQKPRRDPIHAFPDHHVHTDDKMAVEKEGEGNENVNPNVSEEKSRKVKVLDTNKRSGEVGKRSPESTNDLTAGGAP